MSNNTVDLSGYLVVGNAWAVEAGKQQAPVVDGWIVTDLASVGGQHPFSAAGKPAEVILDFARRSRLDLRACDSQQRVGVTARGRLVSGPERSFLQVKHISFYDTSNPLSAGKTFITNTVKLQGSLTLNNTSTPIEIGGHQVTILEATLSTDRSYMGGQHPVILAGKLGERVLKEYGRALASSGTLTLSATVGGALLTIQHVIYVQANYLSIAATT